MTRHLVASDTFYWSLIKNKKVEELRLVKFYCKFMSLLVSGDYTVSIILICIIIDEAKLSFLESSDNTG